MRWLELVVFLVVAGCRDPVGYKDIDIFSPEPSGGRSPKLSLVQLLSDPRSYDGLDVYMLGFAGTVQGTDAIFLHRLDYENAVLINSIRLQFVEGASNSPKPACYVAVEGMFVSDPIAETGQVGRLQVGRIAPWFLAKDPDECKR